MASREGACLIQSALQDPAFHDFVPAREMLADDNPWPKSSRRRADRPIEDALAAGRVRLDSEPGNHTVFSRTEALVQAAGTAVTTDASPRQPPMVDFRVASESFVPAVRNSAWIKRSLCPALGQVIHTVGQVDPRSPFSRTHAIPSTCSKRRSADTRSAPVSMA